MVIVAGIVVVIAGFAIGWAARQRRELFEQELKIDSLLVENTTLRASVKSHEVCLTLLLAEMEKFEARPITGLKCESCGAVINRPVAPVTFVVCDSCAENTDEVEISG